jgi:ankyrin repeat protein
VNVNEQTRYGTPLLIAAHYQWLSLAHGGALSAFSLAAEENRQGNAVKILIEKGADPNARDSDGRNALMVMSLETLLVGGMEISLQGGGTRESRQQWRRNDKAVEMIGETLLNAGGDVNAADNKGRTPLIYAVASERSAVVKLLLKRGANINARDHNGESALDWAIKTGDEEIIRLLSLR